MKKNKKLLGIASLLFVIIAFSSRCINNKAIADPRGTAFAPEQNCRQCHQAIYDSALSSAHFNASASATAKNVLGNFNAGHNAFVYDSVTSILMEQRDSGLYQVLYRQGRPDTAHRFDIIFGVRNAQTSLYWQNNRTYELPVSFYRAVNNWGTSPGFSSTTVNFNRLIGMDCFECHSSYIRNKKGAATGNYFATDETLEAFDKSSLVTGIGCQRCHGPAAAHAAFQQQNPGIKTAKYINSIGSLGRQQQLDNCAVCHSGNDKRKLQSRFMFRPGDVLADYFLPATTDNANHFDVHGNQFNLLRQSKCFLQSNSITCNTCHNPHNNANQSVAVYSQKCISCHQQGSDNFCTVKNTDAAVLANNCIDCHMPKQSSDAISFRLAGNAANTAYQLRTHRIAVYKASVKK